MNELRLQRRRSALDRIEDVSARIDAIAAPDATDVEERVTSVHAGYDETTAITNQAGTTSTAADTTQRIISARSLEHHGKQRNSPRQVRENCQKRRLGAPSRRSKPGDLHGLDREF